MLPGVTLLVLDLRPPAPGTFVEALLQQWPTYLAYLIVFLTIGSIWLSATTTRSPTSIVRTHRCSRSIWCSCSVPR